MSGKQGGWRQPPGVQPPGWLGQAGGPLLQLAASRWAGQGRLSVGAAVAGVGVGGSPEPAVREAEEDRVWGGGCSGAALQARGGTPGGAVVRGPRAPLARGPER